MDKAYAYVSRSINREFESYARSCGLTSQSELVKLLIKRELKLCRLEHRNRDRVRQAKAADVDRKKITAHLSVELGSSFSDHIRKLGLSASHATSMLVEGELKERWLETAISWEPRE